MSSLVTCPSCKAAFPLADWVRFGTCPACGERVGAMAAAGVEAAARAAASTSAAPAVVGMAATDAHAAASRAVAAAADTLDLRTAASLYAPVAATFDGSRTGPETSGRTWSGMPLRWSSGWTALVIVWAVVALLLAGARVEMGHLAVLSPQEKAAITAVEKAQISGVGVAGETLLQFIATHDVDPIKGLVTHPAGQATWYVYSQSWGDHKTYVTWDLPNTATFTWVVQGGNVSPDPDTEKALQQWARTMANPPTGPAPIPGVIPSIPPGL